MTDKLTDLLNGRYRDPQTGEPIRLSAGSIVIERDLSGMEADLVRSLNFGKQLAVVSDEQTHEACGRRIVSALRSLGSVVSLVLPQDVHPDIETVNAIARATVSADALIAVGSGTINDLCKYTSASQKKPYAVFATAPSMNGYTSVNAAITVSGLKKTLPAQGAAGVFMDVNVLAQSPMRLILSGFGDSICRSTAQTDWFLSHRIQGTEYRDAPYDLLIEEEAALFAEPAAIAARDPGAIHCLSRVLTLSGLGMTVCGGSAPFSQGEHMISHFMEMMPPAGWRHAYHGEQIAVTTITSAAVQETLLAGPAPKLTVSKTTRSVIHEVFGAELGELCWEQYAPKQLRAEVVDGFNGRLEAAWPDLQARAAANPWTSHRIRETLKAAGAPTVPEDIGLTVDYYRSAVSSARTIRNRFSFLDIACDMEVPLISPPFDKNGDGRFPKSSSAS